MHLIEDVEIEIFKYLTHAELILVVSCVCRRYRRIIFEIARERLWREMDIVMPLFRRKSPSHTHNSSSFPMFQYLCAKKIANWTSSLHIQFDVSQSKSSSSFSQNMDIFLPDDTVEDIYSPNMLPEERALMRFQLDLLVDTILTHCASSVEHVSFSILNATLDAPPFVPMHYRYFQNLVTRCVRLQSIGMMNLNFSPVLNSQVAKDDFAKLLAVLADCNLKQTRLTYSSMSSIQANMLKTLGQTFRLQFPHLTSFSLGMIPPTMMQDKDYEMIGTALSSFFRSQSVDELTMLSLSNPSKENIALLSQLKNVTDLELSYHSETGQEMQNSIHAFRYFVAKRHLLASQLSKLSISFSMTRNSCDLDAAKEEEELQALLHQTTTDDLLDYNLLSKEYLRLISDMSERLEELKVKMDIATNPDQPDRFSHSKLIRLVGKQEQTIDLPCLQYLELSVSNYIYATHILCMMRSAPNLRLLHIRGATHFPPDLMELLAHVCKTLSATMIHKENFKLIIDDLYHDSHFMLTQWTRLETWYEENKFVKPFNVKHNSKLTITLHGVDSMPYLFEILHQIMKAPEVERVKLNYCTDDEQWASWSRFYPNATIWELPRMVVLKNCSELLQKRVISLTLPYTSPQLLQHLMEKFTFLQSLELIYKSQLETTQPRKRSMTMIITDANKLQHLRVLKFWNFEDASVIVAILKAYSLHIEELHFLGRIYNYEECFIQLEEAQVILPNVKKFVIFDDNVETCSDALSSFLLNGLSPCFPTLSSFIVGCSVPTYPKYSLPPLVEPQHRSIVIKDELDMHYSKHYDYIRCVGDILIRLKDAEPVEEDIKRLDIQHCTISSCTTPIAVRYPSISAFLKSRQAITHKIMKLRSDTDKWNCWRMWFEDFKNVQYWYLPCIRSARTFRTNTIRSSYVHEQTVVPKVTIERVTMNKELQLDHLRFISIDAPQAFIDGMLRSIPEFFQVERNLKVHLGLSGEFLLFGGNKLFGEMVNSAEPVAKPSALTIAVEPKLIVNQVMFSNLFVMFPNLEMFKFKHLMASQQVLHVLMCTLVVTSKKQLIGEKRPVRVCSAITFCQSIPSEDVLFHMYVLFREGRELCKTRIINIHRDEFAPEMENLPVPPPEDSLHLMSKLYNVWLNAVLNDDQCQISWKQENHFQVKIEELPQFVEAIRNYVKQRRAPDLSGNKRKRQSPDEEQEERGKKCKRENLMDEEKLDTGVQTKNHELFLHRVYNGWKSGQPIIQQPQQVVRLVQVHYTQLKEE